MRAFPRLSLLYQAWADEVQSRGNVVLRTQQQVTRVLRGDHVQLWSRSTGGTDNEQRVRGPLGMETNERFDELIMAVDADSALKILGENASWLEKKILGNVKVSARGWLVLMASTLRLVSIRRQRHAWRSGLYGQGNAKVLSSALT